MEYFLTVMALVVLPSGPATFNSTSPILPNLAACERAEETARTNLDGLTVIAWCTEAGEREQGSQARVNVPGGGVNR